MATQFLFFFLALFLSPVFAIRYQKPNPEAQVFSLSLHPRGSLENSQHKNYTALAISDLAADEARAKYLTSRLRKTRSVSNPDSQVEDVIESPITNQGGAYVARIGVGQPASDFSLLADTGSEITWVKCSPCDTCNPNSDSIFDPSQSSSFQPLTCDSQQCSGLPDSGCGSTDNSCDYSTSYGDQSQSSGQYVTETLTVGSSSSVNNVIIGCGHNNNGVIDRFSGILGLGPDPVSFSSQIKATSFSYCLVDPDSQSSSTLDFNSAAPGDSVSVQMIRNSNNDIYYYVELTGITVGEDQIQIPASVYQISSDGTSGGFIVDSGTTLTLLDPQIYVSVRDAFRKNAQNLTPAPGVGNYETCYDVPSGTSSSGIDGPAMSFQFSNGETLPLGPENYSRRVGDSTFCLAFVPTNQQISIIGNVQQHGMRVTYDLQNNIIGFSPKKC